MIICIYITKRPVEVVLFGDYAKFYQQHQADAPDDSQRSLVDSGASRTRIFLSFFSFFPHFFFPQLAYFVSPTRLGASLSEDVIVKVRLRTQVVFECKTRTPRLIKGEALKIYTTLSAQRFASLPLCSGECCSDQ